MVKASLYGATQAHMTVTFIKIISMVQVNTSGLMAEFIMDNGLIIKWKDQEPSLGVMDVDTLDNTKMTKSTIMHTII